jgi:hypothetical protein
MEKINFSDLANWCAACGYHLEDWVPSLVKAAEQVQLALPNEPQALAELIDDLTNLEPAETERLIWVRDWTIWNERSQEIGLRHLRLLVDSAPSSVSEVKGHVYILQPSEWREAIALLTVPILYGWDAHLFFGSGTVLVDVSHDGYVSVSFRSKNSAEAARLQAWQSPGKAAAKG